MQPFEMTPRTGVVTVLTAALFVLTSPLSAQRYELTGSDVAVFNIAGEVSIRGGAGSSVTVQVNKGGSDAASLAVETGPIDDRETLRIVYPDSRIRYPDMQYGETTLRVREDGTFGDHDRGRRYRGDRTVVTGRGRGIEAFADLDVTVPRGQRFAMYLGVGRITVTNVDGDLRVDTSSGPIAVDGVTGTLDVDTGSGEVRVRSAEGAVNIDTGSGQVIASAVRGESLRVDTGSGSVDVSDIAVSMLNIDTGSGKIDARGVAAQSVRLDTGSGSVNIELTQDTEEIVIDTGSGSVTVVVPESWGAEVELETGSGNIDIDMPLTVSRWKRDHVMGTIGDGRGRAVIDTGSGGIRVRRRS